MGPERGQHDNNGSLSGDPRKFIGGEQDAETAFDNLGARYYRNVWGRFTSPDPIVPTDAQTNPQMWNRYSYALNSPLRFSDPSGMAPTEDKPIEAEAGGPNCTFSCEDFEAWANKLYMTNMILAVQGGKAKAETLLNQLPPGTREAMLYDLIMSIVEPLMSIAAALNPFSGVVPELPGWREYGFSAFTIAGTTYFTHERGEYSPPGSKRATVGFNVLTPEVKALTSSSFYFHLHPAGEVVSYNASGTVKTTTNWAQELNQGDKDAFKILNYDFAMLGGARDGKLTFYNSNGKIGDSMSLWAFLGIK